MQRRQFIAVLGGAVVAWPVVRAHSSPSACGGSPSSSRSRRRSGISGSRRGIPSGLRAIGLDHRPQRAHRHPLGHGQCCPTFARHAAELVALAPDVILARGASTVGLLLQATRTVPIVFPVAVDPVGAGFVDSLARPAGNATGFLSPNTVWAGNDWSCSSRSRRG